MTSIDFDVMFAISNDVIEKAVLHDHDILFKVTNLKY